MDPVTAKLAVESLWLSEKPSERWIRRSEIRFHMETLCANTRKKTKKKLFLNYLMADGPTEIRTD